MIKPRIAVCLFLLLSAFWLGASWPAHAQSVGNPSGAYMPTYKTTSATASCTIKGQNKLEAVKLQKSINVNLDTLSNKVTSRVTNWGHRTAQALSVLDLSLTAAGERSKDELIKAQEAALEVEKNQIIDDKSREATQAMEPSETEKGILNGLAYYQPDLAIGARQSEMMRYIAELDNTPLPNNYRDSSTGQPLVGYVDTSRGDVVAMGQEFRNFVRLFCSSRSMNGKMASTKFVSSDASIGEYFCGQDRGLIAPAVTKDPKTGRYIPLQGTALQNYVDAMSKAELDAAKNGQGNIKLINAPKNVAELYFEPRSLSMRDKDFYDKAEQEFARLVIGRANNINLTSDYGTGEGQRQFMFQQARVAKLALARYPFADMFSQKIAVMPSGSATWAAELMEENLDGCKDMPTEGQCVSPSDELKQKCSYLPLCQLSKQLRAKQQISESEFYDVLFNRQFMGTAFSTKLVGMSEGQLKRLQSNLMGLQLALNYQRNRLKEQQLALMAAIYAQQNR